jgi:hypothetical protein
LAGPNPYQVHSFRELRAVMGRVYVTCEACRRFVGVGAWLDSRDTRTTVFSCSVCGDAGAVVFEDPGRRGLQFDLLPNPVRHPAVALRLQHVRQLKDRFGHKAAAREGLPHHERPRHAPEPRYRLRPMPFSTFGELPALGLVLEVGCVGCRSRQVVEINERLAPKMFGRVRFLCSAVRPGRDAACGGPGVPQLVPAAAIDRSLRFVTLTCPVCVPPWTVRDVVLVQAPWCACPIDPATERYRCPACGGQVRATFHGAAGSSTGFAGHLLRPSDG